MNNKKQQMKTEITKNTIIRYTTYCYILSIGIILLFIIFMPYLADYYLRQPDINILEYYRQHAADKYYDFETIVVALFMFAILCFTKRIGAAICAASIPFMVLAHASSVKYAARNELFHIDDLKLKEAAGMALRYLDFKFTHAQLAAIGMVFFFCISGVILDRFRKKYPLPFLVREKRRSILDLLRVLIGCACLTVMVCYGYRFIESMNSMAAIDSWDAFGIGEDRYVLYSFLKNDKYTNITVTNVEESYDYFEANLCNIEENIGSNQRPTVIAIMNESWWNTDNIKDGSIFSSDPMLIYKELAQKCSVGNLSTNVFGGGTVSPEAEFLTGVNTKHLLSDIGIYQELADRKVSSIVDYFHALDYRATAIHPYYGNFYDRDKIYSIMGFDKIIFEEDMDFTDIYTKYISDESLVKQIIKEYEEGLGAQNFIFAVSIANHIRLLDDKADDVTDYDYPISIAPDRELFHAKYYDDFVNYINGIYLANEAFAQLVAYFEEVDEPVVLVMYGDHCPSFSSEIMTAIEIDGTDYEALKCQYSVPVIMWSNFNDERVEFTGQNINYLPQMLLEYAGLPESDMTQILRYERSVFKADTRRFVEDANGNPIAHYNDEQNEATRHFKAMDYDILFGSSSQRTTLWQPHGIENALQQ